MDAAQQDTPDSPYVPPPFSCYISRLWHQLTLTIFDFFDHPDSPPYQLDLFEHFVSDFQNKLDKLRLAQIGTKVSKQIPR
jgi:26S proteasome regulatory subunit N9